MMSRFGTLIRTNRKALCLTLADVAKKAKTHKGYISGIETGKVNPPAPSLVKRLASILNLDTDSLLILAWAEKAPQQVRARILESVSGLLKLPD